MKIKNKTILDFAGLAIGDKHLPVKVSFALSVNAEAVNGALKAFNEHRRAMIEKYAKKGADGELVVKENGTYDIEDVENWNKEYNELLEAEVEVAITTINMEELKKCDEGGFDDLNLAEINMMRFMIEA